MSNNMLLFVGIFTFVLMVVGLVLTMLEFRYGAPSRQKVDPRRENKPVEASNIDAQI